MDKRIAGYLARKPAPRLGPLTVSFCTKNKRTPRPMLGLKNFGHAAITIAGVELLHRIRKGQFALGRLRMSGAAAPDIWNAVLAARVPPLLIDRFKTSSPIHHVSRANFATEPRAQRDAAQTSSSP
jgi:hypothetical protein